MDKWVMTYSGLPVTAGPYRPPDLSFLPQATAPPQPAESHSGSDRSVEELARTPVEWLLGTMRVSLALLFQLATPTPATVRAAQHLVIEGKEVAEVRELSLGAEQVQGLDVDVKLYTDPHDRSHTRLEVHARAVDRPDLDFARTHVALRLADGSEISQFTDELGLASFVGLSEDELSTAMLEITPASEYLSPAGQRPGARRSA